MNRSAPAEPVTICIADWPATLWFDPLAGPARARFLEHYRAFIVPFQTEAPALQVRVEPGPLFVPVEPGPWRIVTRQAGGRLEFASHFEQGWVDLAAGRGELTLRPNGDPENFLRVWYAWRSLGDGALLLHACGVVRDGGGYVFFGPSGSGKTTIARFSLEAGATVLSDDLVILRKKEAAWWVIGVPFRGDFVEAPRTNQAAPAQGIYALAKAARHEIERLRPAEAVARLSACAPFVMSQPHAALAVTQTCAELASSGLVRLLRFRRDPDFWRVIDGLE